MQGTTSLESEPSNVVRIPIQFGPTHVQGEQTTPEEYQLHQNYPNPFNPTTSINFDLPEESRVTLNVFDILGREVIILAEGHFPAGRASVTWDARNRHGIPVTSGVYFCMLKAQGESFPYVQIRKMLLLK
jgi:hypothetical protein